MTLGSSNTPIEGSEIDIPSIVASATEHISLDGNGNVDIPNGNLTLGSSNEFRHTTPNTGSLHQLININSNNDDLDIVRVNGNGFNSDGAFGYSLRYEGTGSGNSNFLTFFADQEDIGPQVASLRLDQSANVEIPNGQAVVQDGVESNPSYVFSSDNSTGMYYSGGGELALTSSGNDKLAFRGGDIRTYSNIDMATSGSIKDAGTDSITFDGTQNVDIPNGNLDVGGEISADENIVSVSTTGNSSISTTSQTASNFAEVHFGESAPTTTDGVRQGGHLRYDVDPNLVQLGSINESQGTPFVSAIEYTRSSGEVEIPNGDLTVSIGDINVNSGARVGTGIGGGGEYSIDFGGNSEVGLYTDVDFTVYESDGSRPVFSARGNDNRVDVLEGSLRIDSDNEGVEFGANQDFDISYESASDELVISDGNGIELIRQPKAGSTQFLQGIDAGSIEAPTDSFTQLANASVTSSLVAGDRVGYTFALDNQTFLGIDGEADGSGGIQNTDVTIPNGDLTDGSQVIWDSSASEIPDSAMGSIDTSTLTNDSVTYTAGDGLKGGGTVALGGSSTVNIEPADFAGVYLSDDGSDNLTVDIGRGLENDGAGSIRFDENTAYTFTANQTFSGDVLDSSANIVYDQSANQIPRARLDGNKITNVITTNTTTSDEEILYVDTSGGPVTITLASADVLDGNEITIVDSGGSAETNAITIGTEGAETIDGASTSLIETNYSAQAVASDGSNWFTTGAGGGGGGGNLSDVIIDIDKDWQNFDISNVRKLSAEDGVINGKTLETGNNMTIQDDESMVVSGSYTVDGNLTIEGSGSLTVI